jgi:hypothetical protein
MLDLQMLKAMPPKTIFAVGVAKDNIDGLFMANTDKELMWCAVRGEIHDWAIYCAPTPTLIEFVVCTGDKVYSEKFVRFCVPCDDESLKMYRK